MNIKEVEEKLKNIAENVVGNIGERTIDTSYSPTGEQFTHCGCMFRSTDDEYLLEKWTIVVRGLVHASLLTFGKKHRDIGGGDKPKLYWRILPSIEYDSNAEIYRFRTRLLVTCNPELQSEKQKENKAEATT